MALSKITTASITDNAVTSSKVSDTTIATADIADGGITTVKLAADAVDGTKLADNAVNSEHYTDGSIDTAHVADVNITTAKLADDSVTQAKIGADAVGTTELANDVAISTSGAITTTGAFTSIGIDDNADANALTIDSSEKVHLGTASLTSKLNVVGDGNTKGLSIKSGGNGSVHPFQVTWSAGAEGAMLKVDDNGNTHIGIGNLVIGTNGKGIDFTSNSNVSGMTSELLDDYEEGSATVNMVSSGATFAFGGSDGSETTLYYIKIGRLVHYFMNWDSSSTVSGTTSNSVQIQNLPFSSSYGDTFAVWFHRGGPGAVDILVTAYGTNMGFMVSPTAGGMWSDMTAGHLSHVDMRLRISGTTIVA